MDSPPIIISTDRLVNSLPEAALVQDRDGIIRAVSEKFLALVQHTREDLIGHSLASVLPELSQLLHEDGLAKSPFTLTRPYQGRYVQIKRSSLDTETGETIGELILLTDQTANKMVQQALLAYERRYRALFDYSNDAIIIVDLDLYILVANEQSARLLDVDLSILLQSQILDYVPPERQVAFYQRCIEVKQGASVSLIEDELLNADRSRRIPVEVSLFLVLDSDHQPLHIQIILRDITERKRAEASMRQRIEELNLLHQADQQVAQSLDIDPVLRGSLDAAMLLANADAGFIALTWEELFLVTHTAGLYPPDVVGLTLIHDIGIVGRVIKSQQPEWIGDVNADPDYYPDVPTTESAMVIPMIAQDQFTGVIVLETNTAAHFTGNKFRLTQLLATRLAFAIENARLYDYMRQQIDELTGLYQAVRKAEALKTDMIRLANHDIKNPLNVIRGYLELMLIENESLDEMTLKYVNEMLQAVHRSEDILKEFLSIESINERTRGATLEAIDIALLLKRAVSEYRIQTQRRGLMLHVSQTVQPGQAIVYGDGAQLYEAMTNLLSNAIKYTPEGGEIELSLTIAQVDQIHFTVRDTGHGIPEDQQQNLFKPFYRPRISETARIDGTGLGLYLVKSIIERHQGMMLFESTYSEGSVFGFVLPRMLPS